MNMTISAFLLLAAASVQPAVARDITIQMKNHGQAGMMVFEPGYVAANPGDTIHFVPTDFGHNVQPIAGMLPDGVSLPAGRMNKEYVFTAEKPGLYGFECQPHFSMGMVALVKVGRGPAPNRDAMARVQLSPLAARRMAPMLAAAQ